MRLISIGDDLFGRPVVIGAESGEVSVREIPKDQADKVMKENHYSRSSVWSSSVHLGVYLSGDMIGAIQYGPAMNPASGAKIVRGARKETWVELNRLWLSDDKPPNTSSRAIACSLRTLRKLKPMVEWVQTFADERCEKFGAVYQACSFLYCGEHTGTFLEIDGVPYHKSMIDRPALDKRGWRPGPKVSWVKANADRGLEREWRQFRYIKFLDNRARGRLLLDVLPYPKPNG